MQVFCVQTFSYLVAWASSELLPACFYLNLGPKYWGEENYAQIIREELTKFVQTKAGLSHLLKRCNFTSIKMKNIRYHSAEKISQQTILSKEQLSYFKQACRTKSPPFDLQLEISFHQCDDIMGLPSTCRKLNTRLQCWSLKKILNNQYIARVPLWQKWRRPQMERAAT